MNWGNIEHRTSNAEHRMKDQPALPGRARHSVRAFWRCPASRAAHHVRGGQGTARPTGFMVPMHATHRKEALHEPANSLLKKSIFRRRRGDESQISWDFERQVRDSLRRLLLFQQAAKARQRGFGLRRHVCALIRRDMSTLRSIATEDGSRRRKRRHAAALRTVSRALKANQYEAMA